MNPTLFPEPNTLDELLKFYEHFGLWQQHRGWIETCNSAERLRVIDELYGSEAAMLFGMTGDLNALVGGARPLGIRQVFFELAEGCRRLYWFRVREQESARGRD